MKALQESIKIDALSQPRQGRSVHEVSRYLHISMGTVSKSGNKTRKIFQPKKQADLQRFPRPPRPKMLEGLEDLRGGKDTITLNIVVLPNRTESFPWTTDTETTTINKLEKAIYAGVSGQGGGRSCAGGYPSTRDL
jgi:hypothetical protein